MKLADMIEAKKRLDEQLQLGQDGNGRQSLEWFSKVLGEAIAKIEYTQAAFGITFDSAAAPRKPVTSVQITRLKLEVG